MRELGKAIKRTTYQERWSIMKESGADSHRSRIWKES